MLDINAIESRIKWLESSITDTLAWGLDESTDPILLKHAMATENAMSLELGQLVRDLKYAKEINARVLSARSRAVYVKPIRAEG